MDAGDLGPTQSRGLEGAAIFGDPLVEELLGARLIAHFATLNRDGTIHLVPMWFARDAGTILLATGSGSDKVRNLERDARATLMVHDSRPGFEVCGVSLVGEAAIVRGHDGRRLAAVVHRRYVREEAEALPAVREFLSSDDVAVRFEPRRALTWDERPSEAAISLRDSGLARALVSTSSRAELRGEDS